ncbi:nuclear transport factor 2 family protein [Dactylosporangium sp. CS-047395]|uniref:nuclear transport factor 2 family protein n=1 Tax=Dactylosporangium sp. CS-047395 TaxID=3239936 RepID=UPI003D92C689
MDLSPAIATYLTAHNARDTERAIASFTPDAEVVDEGHSHHGTDAIREWLGSAASEYTYTTELVSAMRVDDDRYDVVQHLEGNFPGGVVDLHYRFTMRGDAVARLVIEP